MFPVISMIYLITNLIGLSVIMTTQVKSMNILSTITSMRSQILFNI